MGRRRKERLPSESTWFPNDFDSWKESKAEGLCSLSLDGTDTASHGEGNTGQSLLCSSFLLELHFSIWRMSQCSGNEFLTGGGETEALSSAREITKYHQPQAPEAASCPWTLFPAREWLARASLNRNYLWRQSTQEGQVIHQVLVLPGLP